MNFLVIKIYLVLSAFFEFGVIYWILMEIRGVIVDRSRKGVRRVRLIPRSERFKRIRQVARWWWIFVFLIPIVNLFITLLIPGVSGGR